VTGRGGGGAQGSWRTERRGGIYHGEDVGGNSFESQVRDAKRKCHYGLEESMRCMCPREIERKQRRRGTKRERERNGDAVK